MQRHEPKKTVGEVMRENAELSTSHALPHSVFAYTPIGKFIWFIVFAISLGNYRVIINAYYRPQRSSGKVMFSQACVKNSVHRGGGMCATHAPLPRTLPTMHVPPAMHAPLPCTPCHTCSPAIHAHQHACPPNIHVPPPILRDAVNERAVRILLECILVYYTFDYNCNLDFL